MGKEDKRSSNYDNNIRKQVMHKTVAHYPLTCALPVLEQWLHPGQLPTVLKAFLHVVVWYGIAIWPAQLSSLGSVPSSFPH